MAASSGNNYLEFLLSREPLQQDDGGNQALPRENNLVQPIIKENYETVVPLLIESASRSRAEDFSPFILITSSTGSVMAPDENADLVAMNEAFLERARSGSLPDDIRKLVVGQIVSGLQANNIRIDNDWMVRLKAGARYVKQLLQRNIGGDDISLSNWIVALSLNEDLRFDFASVVAATYNYETSQLTRVSNTKFEKQGAETLLAQTLRAIKNYEGEIAMALGTVGGSSTSFSARIR